MKLIIDAVSRGSGGAKRHLTEILYYSDNNFCKFSNIEVWGPKSLLDILPANPKIIKKSHILLNYGSLGFLIFNTFFKKVLFKNFDIIFSPFGNFTLSLHPYVSMSRNMLMFDKTERRRFKFGLFRLKLKYLSYVNSKSFKNADGLIFLSRFAKNKINEEIDLKGSNQTIIHHGISNSFRKAPSQEILKKKEFKFLYVSHLLPYKHHVNLIESFIELSNEGNNIKLLIIGDDSYKEIGKKIRNIISKKNNSEIIKWISNVGLNDILKYYQSSDIFIFGSSCENMPNTLIEAMSSGLPILSSNYPPMPEFLGSAGIYFDPLSKISIKASVLKILENKHLAFEIANESFKMSNRFSWRNCAEQTFEYLHNISKDFKNEN